MTNEEFDQEPAHDSSREITDRFVHRTMLAFLLARATLDQDESQQEAIQNTMDVIRGVLVSQTAQVFEQQGFPLNVRNVMASNMIEEITEIRLLAQKMARDITAD